MSVSIRVRVIGLVFVIGVSYRVMVIGLVLGIG